MTCGSRFSADDTNIDGRPSRKFSCSWMATSRSHWWRVNMSRHTPMSSMPITSCSWSTFSVCSVDRPSFSIIAQRNHNVGILQTGDQANLLKMEIADCVTWFVERLGSQIENDTRQFFSMRFFHFRFVICDVTPKTSTKSKRPTQIERSKRP